MPKVSRPATHHDRILSEIRARIVAGAWPPGFQLPAETELAARHDVSRMTMNKVLTQLSREGYLVRRRRRGTFVATPRAQSAVLKISDIEAEVRALGLAYRFALAERRRRPATAEELAAARPHADGSGEVLALRGVHFAGDAPFCHEARVINLAAAPEAGDQDFAGEAPGHWLLRQIPWSAAEHRIRAVGAAGPVAAALGLRAGTPCLEILRRTEAAGQWVTVVRFTYPGERHQLFARFAPDPAE